MRINRPDSNFKPSKNFRRHYTQQLSDERVAASNDESPDEESDEDDRMSMRSDLNEMMFGGSQSADGESDIDPDEAEIDVDAALLDPGLSHPLFPDDPTKTADDSNDMFPVSTHGLANKERKAATCYVSSALQAYAHLKPFSSTILDANFQMPNEAYLRETDPAAYHHKAYLDSLKTTIGRLTRQMIQGRRLSLVLFTNFVKVVMILHDARRMAKASQKVDGRMRTVTATSSWNGFWALQKASQHNTASKGWYAPC